jgi:hypothetical protein
MTDCDIGRCLAVARLRERLSASKGVAELFDVQRFDLKEQNGARVKKRVRPNSEKELQF